jgi:hypothetical protein
MSSEQPNVDVSLPLIFEMSGLDILLFGERYEISGHIIYAKYPLPLSNFYNLSGGVSGPTGWLKYQQDLSENTFTAAINDISNIDTIIETVLDSVNYYDGSGYDVSGINSESLDASGIFTDVSGWGGQYNSIQDFVISYFAWKILGHPGALAAISNDSAIRSYVTSTLPGSLEQLKTMEQNKLNVIVQQIMDQDLARFNEDSTSEWAVVKWIAGDKIRLHLQFKDNTYSIGTAINTQLPVSNTPDNYMIEFVLE